MKDVSTAGKVDRAPYEFNGAWYTLGETYTYETVGGSAHTIYVFRQFPLKISDCLKSFQDAVVMPAIEHALSSAKLADPPKGAELAKLQHDREAYRSKQVQLARLKRAETEKKEREELEQRAEARFQMAKQRLAVAGPLNVNILARKYLKETMTDFPTTAAANKAEDLLNADNPDRFRTFTSGRYSATAVFIGMAGADAVLKKSNGKIVQVPVTKLSEKDQQYIHEELINRDRRP